MLRPLRLRLLVFAAGLLLAAGAGAAETQSGVVDQPVRFVNSRVVTIGDLRNRNAVRAELWRREGRVLPDTPMGMLGFFRDTLEELTEEELLVQKADELQVPIDHDRLAGEVTSEAKQRGLGFREMATLRGIRERQAKMDAVLGWFEARSASPGPEALRDAYARRQADFTRPPRAETLLIALRPTPADERAALVKALARLMRDAQGATVPAIRDAAASRLDAFLAADSAGQEAILAALARALAAIAPPAGADAAVIATAVRLNAEWNAVCDAQQCRARLAALRDELLDLPPPLRGAVFRDRAQRISQGPHAIDGGELGWVEPGTYGAEIEAQALAMPPFEPSEPFATGDAQAMVLVIRREEGRTQSFAEVSSALYAGMERQRRDAVRKRVTGVLRAQASVRDVVDLKELLQ